MALAAGPRSIVTDARKLLEVGRAKLREMHDNRTPGVQVCARMTDLLDTIILDIFRATVEDVAKAEGLKPEQIEAKCSLVPHGGLGRRDVAPYSDVDLMLLYRPDADELIEQIAKRLTQDICDVGLDLGFSVRTPKQACSLAAKEIEVLTSLAESRYLAGSVGIYKKFMSALARQSSRGRKALVKSIADVREIESNKWGESVYMLRPNVKRSAGGLRDLHVIRWLGFVRFGESDLDTIYRMGALHQSDFRQLTNAKEFLLRLRNELHFHAGKSQDLLGRNEQVRLAKHMNYEGQEDELKPVVRLMRDYFEHSTNIRNAASYFMAASRWQFRLTSWLEPMVSRNIEDAYRVGPIHIGVVNSQLDRVKGSLVDVLHLMKLANVYNKRIEFSTWEAIRKSMLEKEKVLVTVDAAENFMNMLVEPNRLAPLIRMLHQVGVLQNLIPGFRHARGLMQFNHYHKYTVDEHSIIALETATNYINDEGPVGQVYRSLKRPELLHLAILFHDLGKGLPGDHSEVGAAMVEENATSLNLTTSQTKAVKFLVEKHLLMAHLAFRRDISDDAVVAQFAADVGRPDYLKMLYVLTCADVTAVGPGVLTDWKYGFLTDLFNRAMYLLSGDSPISVSDPVEPKRALVRELATMSERTTEYMEIIEQLPSTLWRDAEPEAVGELIDRIEKVGDSDVVVKLRRVPTTNSLEIVVVMKDSFRSGSFYRLTGAITSSSLEIFSADIHSLSGSKMLCSFMVLDPDFDETPDSRLDLIQKRIVQEFQSEGVPPVFPKKWGARTYTSAASKVAHMPSKVRFDTETLEYATIIDVFTHDRAGLLYAIAKHIFDLGLDIQFAKVGTYLDQVVDVFYVSDMDGNKITDREHLEQIRSHLLDVVSQYKP